MKCPDCHGTHSRKNGHRQHKQNYICVSCGRQFLAQYEPRGYSDNYIAVMPENVPHLSWGCGALAA